MRKRNALAGYPLSCLLGILHMRIKLIILAIAFAGFITLGVTNITNHNQKLQFKQIELKDTSVKLKQLEEKYDLELQQKNVNEENVKKLQQEKQELEKQLQAKAAEKKRLAELQTTQKAYAATAAPKAPTAAPSVASRGNCGDNMYKQYIYQHESGCDTNRYNSIGCYGIGQSCPKSKIAHCGADFACQDAWFSNYAVQRYGGWEGAYNFWLQNKWW